MTLLQRNFVTAKPINFYYLVCKLDMVQYRTMLVTNKSMVGIKNIVKVVMTRNHFVIGGVKPSRRKHGQKLID